MAGPILGALGRVLPSRILSPRNAPIRSSSNIPRASFIWRNERMCPPAQPKASPLGLVTPNLSDRPFLKAFWPCVPMDRLAAWLTLASWLGGSVNWGRHVASPDRPVREPQPDHPLKQRERSQQVATRKAWQPRCSVVTVCQNTCPVSACPRQLLPCALGKLYSLERKVSGFAVNSFGQCATLNQRMQKSHGDETEPTAAAPKEDRSPPICVIYTTNQVNGLAIRISCFYVCHKVD